MHYQELIKLGRPLPPFGVAGFRAYSQNEEDGILLLLFAALGVTNRVCADIGFCVADGANTTNLICNWGWEGFLVEGDPVRAQATRTFFATNRDAANWPPRLVERWVTAENVNEIFDREGVAGEIDLLSLDLDGNDYWVWKALEAVRPRVVLVEAQIAWGGERSVTIPYRADFSVSAAPHPAYSGASAAALVALGRAKGYRLVGSIRHGYNLFFVRDELADPWFATVAARDCLRHPRAIQAQKARSELELLEWLEV